ncbi:MAG: hypothetical protein KGL48_15165 [Sphingomonadales bacterium]|nr:hypothetical protein [Sphingomonadales bacterium]MDE2567592.1 hypothetical protein [Sphingomonadales bacterium]
MPAIVRALAVIAAAMLLAGTASAAPATSAMNGVWAGTVGKQQVRACFTKRGDELAFGAFYQMAKPVPAELGYRETSATWGEGYDRNGATWTIGMHGHDRIAGSWRKGAHEQPIALARVPLARGDDADSPCGSHAFMAPRLKPVRLHRRPQTIPGLGYSLVTYDVGPAFPSVWITGFVLAGKGAAAKAINAAVRLDPMKAGGEADFSGCMSQSLANVGTDGDFNFSYLPERVSGGLLSVIGTTAYSCGGIHPDAFSFHRLFDLRTGREVRARVWFNARGVKPGQAETADRSLELASALRNAVVAHARKLSEDCAVPVATASWWDVGLARGGLLFTPTLPHAVSACGDPITVPARALAPFLSVEGKAAMARIAPPARHRKRRR